MNHKPTLRVLGTSVTLLEVIRQKAQADLGFEIEYQIHDPQTAQRIAVMYPERYDLYDQWFHNIDFVWPVKSIQPIEIKKIQRWDEINDLAKKGTLYPHQPLAQGGVPSQRLYVQQDHTLSDQESDYISMLPLTHNVDSFIYFPEFLPKQLKGQPESWSWLLNPNWNGAVTVQNDAAIGALDLAMAIQASKQLNFSNIGNLSLTEIDQLMQVLLKLKQTQHFNDFWSDDEHAYRLIAEQNIHIGSLWYPALVKLWSSRQDFKIAKPVEGYRAWFGGLALSRDLEGLQKDRAYHYLNWWLDGWAGAVMARQGMYISNPDTSRQYLSADEWNFWYMGQPAKEPLQSVTGEPLIATGLVREGGSYAERMGHIGVWNSVMDEHNYLVKRWKKLTD